MWTIFKVFIESVTIVLLFYVLVFWPQGMWNLSFMTRDRTGTPALGGEVLTTGLPAKSQFVAYQWENLFKNYYHPVPRPAGKSYYTHSELQDFFIRVAKCPDF